MRKLATDRLSRFCAALHAESAGRRAPWWTSIATVSDRLGIPHAEAIVLADDCAAAGLVVHDQSEHTKARRRSAELAHSVSLKGEGWMVAGGVRKGTRRR